MFGYVIPHLCRLSEEEKKRYKAAYCGLCNSLKERYGTRGRFLVNYDMTFLYCLLEQQRQETLSCSCLTKPFCKRECMPNGDIMAYAADLTVLLSWWKLKDGVADSPVGKKLLYRWGLWLLRKPYRKAADLRQKENEAFRQQLALLDKLEEECCSSMDAVADTFGVLLCGCIPEGTSALEKRILAQLLYHVGRYLYLVDALEDLPRDSKQGAYNPLLYRYNAVDGKLTQEDRESLRNTIEASVDLAASALELLPKGANHEILDNIIYEGLPTVLKSVMAGSFRKRKAFRRSALDKSSVQIEDATQKEIDT